MKKALYLLFFSAISSIAFAGVSSRETREVSMAEKSILYSIIRSRTQGIQDICTSNPDVCFATDQTELALALLGARNSQPSLEAMAKLIRFRLDGAGAESFQCYVLLHGLQILKIWKSASPHNLSSFCFKEVDDAKRSFEASTIRANHVCNTPKDIEIRQKNLMEAIRLGRKCDPSDF